MSPVGCVGAAESMANSTSSLGSSMMRPMSMS